MSLGKLFVHIGGPKTGTTAIQSALAEKRQTLRENGFLYPGIEINQQLAMYPLIRVPGYDHFVSKDPTLWNETIAEVNDWSGDVILSGEALFMAPAEVVAEILKSFKNTQIKILITARSGHEIVVSHWQESVKAGDSISLAQYADEVALGPEHATWKSFTYWAIAYCGSPIDTWASVAGIENVVVQSVDTTKNDETLRCFEEIVGVPSGLLGTSSRNPINRSLTLSETELIRSCNEILLGGSPSNHHYSTLEHGVILNILSKSPSVDDPKIQLPVRYYESIAPFVNAEVERILNSGARIVGDSSLLTRMPETVGDSRLSQIKVDLDVIRIVLEHYLQ